MKEKVKKIIQFIVNPRLLLCLWLPVSPEKIVTFAISIALLRWLFPKDEKTLAVLKGLYGKAKQAIQKKKTKKSAKKKKVSQDTINTIKTQEDCYE